MHRSRWLNERRGGQGERAKTAGRKSKRTCPKILCKNSHTHIISIEQTSNFYRPFRADWSCKGSLSNHLDKLEASGLIKSKIIRTFGGYRMIVSITPKGIEAYKGLISILASLAKA